MNSKNIKIRLLLLSIGLLLVTGNFQLAYSQELRWMRVGQTQTFFEDYGNECELVPFSTTNFLAWPAQYGNGQYTTRAKGVWIGAKNFYDPVEKKTKSVKVVGSGPRYDPNNQALMIFSRSIKLIARSNPPKITVDKQNGTSNSLYDVPDEIDPNLPCERMIVIKYNTSMGVSVTKKIYAFTQQNHDNYFIHDYVFKNTGIYNKAGDTIQQTLNEFWAFFTYRYALAGVSTSTGTGGAGSDWGSFDAEWGAGVVAEDFGPPYRQRSDSLRGLYAFYSPVKSSWGQRNPVNDKGYDWDWGCPKQTGGGENLDGLLGSAKYVGVVTLHASKGTGSLFNVDDYNQPATVNYFDADATPCQTPTSQYDESFMNLRWKIMTEGHLAKSFWGSVGDGRYQADWLNTDPLHPAGGQLGQGFGPYTVAYGDSIHIIFAEGVSGLSWENCRKVGANWYKYYAPVAGAPLPTLVEPNGTVDTSITKYLKAWVFTGIDSILQTYKNARTNYRSGYNIPKEPPAPNQFTVTSGGDKILLEWSNNAVTARSFDGYVIYRSKGIVKDYRAVYEKVFECNKSNVVHEWGDTSAIRGFNYYYYIQAKDDGTQNDVKPGTPLYSSLFLTMTTVPAQLLRPSGNLLGEVRVVPNPYDIRSRKWQFGEIGPYDRIMFYGIPPKCRLKIFTEDGTMIWEKLHTNGSGDEAWDSKTSSNQIAVSGIYILYVEVTEDTYATKDIRAKYDVLDENLKIVFHGPNIDNNNQGDLIRSAGDKIFKAGQSTFRKFVVIR
jgi:hypothetical protein